MNTTLEIKYPVPDRWSYLWLGLGAILLMLSTGSFGVAVAAWVAPVFLIRFFRSRKIGRGYWMILLVTYISYAICWYAILASIMPLPVYLIFIIFVTLINSLPLLADRILAPRLNGFAATLVYPLAVTSIFLIYNIFSPLGSFGTPGYEQYQYLALVQIVSITGLWGITLLVGWFGPVVNWAWERSFNWLQIRRGAAIWGGILGLVLLFGGLRLAFAKTTDGTVRVHGFSPKVAYSLDIPDLNTDLAGYRRSRQAINEELITGTIREARRGAQIVVWPEMAGGGVEEDANLLIERAREVAKQEGIYLAMGLEIHFIGQERPWENKLVLIAPSGETIINHDKFGATFLYNMFGAGEALQGTFSVQTAETPVGTLSGVVCWDADFPMTILQAGKQKAGILFVANGDNDPYQGKLHMQQHVFRAIENGVSLVRQDAHSGYSVTADPFGRVLAMVDLSTASEPVMAAQVPTHGEFTLYPAIGDIFGWLSLPGLAVITGLAIFRSRKPTERAGRTSESQ